MLLWPSWCLHNTEFTNALDHTRSGGWVSRTPALLQAQPQAHGGNQLLPLPRVPGSPNSIQKPGDSEKVPGLLLDLCSQASLSWDLGMSATHTTGSCEGCLSSPSQVPRRAHHGRAGMLWKCRRTLLPVKAQAMHS